MQDHGAAEVRSKSESGEDLAYCSEAGGKNFQRVARRFERVRT